MIQGWKCHEDVMKQQINVTRPELEMNVNTINLWQKLQNARDILLVLIYDLKQH